APRVDRVPLGGQAGVAGVPGLLRAAPVDPVGGGSAAAEAPSQERTSEPAKSCHGEIPRIIVKYVDRFSGWAGGRSPNEGVMSSRHRASPSFHIAAAPRGRPRPRLSETIGRR